MDSNGRRDFLRQSAMLAGGSSVLLMGNMQAPDEKASSGHQPLPPRRRVYEAEPWTSHRGGPGNTGSVADGPVITETPEVAWEAESDARDVAIADGLVFTHFDGAVRAHDAETGALVWETDAIGADGVPAAAYKSVYVGGDQIRRINVANGSVIWERDLGGKSSFSTPTAAYDMIYTVADGDLYALDAKSGRVQWRGEKDIEPSPRDHDIPPRDIQSFVETPVAAHHGLVYTIGSEATPGRNGPILALDAMTGEIQWTTYYIFGYARGLTATDERVAAANSGNHVIQFFDPDYQEYHRGGPDYRSMTGYSMPAIRDPDLIVTMYDFIHVARGMPTPYRFYDNPSFPTLSQEHMFSYGQPHETRERGLYAWRITDGEPEWHVSADLLGWVGRIALDTDTIYACGRTLHALR